MPERGRTWSVYDLFTTADNDQVFIGVTSDRHWQRLCTTFGFEDLAADNSLATNQGRITERDWFLPELQKRFGAMTKEKLMDLAEKAGIPFAPVNRPIDLVSDRHMTESGGLAEVAIPSGGMAKIPKLPLQLNNSSFELRRQPPSIGEGSKDLYRSIGLEEKEIDELIKQGIIQLG
jgi:crotonobetainyl-CoA:carnitine CoA-transferase CaiB-like acyl-CoA transferase